MRLDRIKIVGFKSFVESTVVELPGSLTAVLGPNGCGKSNIIDAVRWVMGESNAKHLRGDSATDVIFSGSKNRKPVGHASVELLFNNSDGSVGGEYASYAEISVKRSISRDGQSNYYLNNTKCRKKDITDIFLGTGMGARSYSIIEQGMISRFIEAKPDDMRTFLEEAAGISKYKERRRETETRIRHTRENLERLTDLREELDKQLAKLAKQSEDAEKYQVLRKDQKLLQAQLYALKWKNLHTKVQQYDSIISEIVAKLEAANAKGQAIGATIDKEQLIKVEVTDKFNAEQEKFYAKSAQIAKLEQVIAHQKERKNQFEKDLVEAEKELHNCLSQQSSDEEKLTHLENTISDLEPEYNELQEVSLLSNAKLKEYEEDMDAWQKEFAEVSLNLATPQREAEVAKTHIQNLEKQISSLSGRISKLVEETGEFDVSSLTDNIEEVKSSVNAQEQLLSECETNLVTTLDNVKNKRIDLESLTKELREKQTRYQECKNKHTRLSALQEAALGKQNASVVKWLEQNSLDKNKRLAQILDVNTGYEKAVEVSLGFAAEAICVDSIEEYYSLVDGIDKGSVILVAPKLEVPSFETSQKQESAGLFAKLASGFGSGEISPLLSKLNNPPAEIISFLSSVYVADSVKSAKQHLDSLKSYESIITKDGTWLGQGWVRTTRGAANEHGGILEREQQLKELTAELSFLEQELNSLNASSEQLRTEVRAGQQAKDSEQEKTNKAKIALSELQSKLNLHTRELAQATSRGEKLEKDLVESKAHLVEAQESLSAEQEKYTKANSQAEVYFNEQEKLQAEKGPLTEKLYEIREKAKLEKEGAHKLQLRLQSARTEKESLINGLARFNKQIENWQEKQKTLQANINSTLEPIQNAEVELESMLEQHVVLEQTLSEARSEMEALQEKIESLESERKVATAEAEEIRNSLEEAKLNWQAEAVRLQGIEEQMTDMDVNKEEVISNLPEDAKEDIMDKNLSKIERQIKSLGPINLAAIQEYSSSAERKEYLDEQNKDLCEALDILDTAIRKIDKETKEKFKATYDKLNEKFQELFPRLFGGGQAYLELTGDDLLETGVGVVARPPGKKNSYISQLSGGEKALTAISLVFAIFHLNPAPFCLLDEVDAPLDDTNVGRFCSLVKEMSEKVQFIYISHNKIAMEMASHLHGVTMKEPGVSRLVSVDMEEAKTFVE